MYSKFLVTKDTYYVGASERRLAKFENVYPLENGASYNSYLIMDEKTCLLDCVDLLVEDTFMKKVEEVLDGRELDYLIINHMEPDHSASAIKIVQKYKNLTVVTTEKAYKMFQNFNNNYEIKNLVLVKEFDTLNLGNHVLTFVMAPMVHWPEVMVTYDTTTKTLFSADAFGTFGALNGNLFADECDFEHQYLDDARRYYTNIVGKYGPQVQALLKKAATIEIQTICPLHGPIWRKNLNWFIRLYDKWSRYEPEVNGALIVYGSVYGHSENAANLIADKLALKGVKNIRIYDASKTDKSVLVAETFKYSHLILCASTYNMGIFTPLEEYLLDLKYHAMQGRTVGIVQNGSWAPNSDKLIREIFGSMKNMNIVEESFTFQSNIKDSDLDKVEKISERFAEDLKEVVKDDNPLFKLGYGLYVLNTKDGDKDNGCILNTVTQVSVNPDKFLVNVNKANYSSEIINKTKEMNISILDTSVPFDIFKRFGFQSGRNVNKFEDFKDFDRSKNGITYLNKFTNSYLSLKVLDTIDFGSHFGYVCEVNDKGLLNSNDSVTYDYYMKNIKPLPPKPEKKINGWICKICGYIYEGEVLPPDFICPLCKHGAEDFERIK